MPCPAHYHRGADDISVLRGGAQELHDCDFGKREEIHKIKRAKRAADVQGASEDVTLP